MCIPNRVSAPFGFLTNPVVAVGWSYRLHSTVCGPWFNNIIRRESSAGARRDDTGARHDRQPRRP
jgi:hypothetical protein